MSPNRRVNFLGCPLDLLTSAALLDELSRHIDSRALPATTPPSPPRPGRGIRGEVSIPGNGHEVRPLVSQETNSPSSARVIQFVNANKVAQVREDSGMGQLMWRAHYVLADGQPILPMARFLGIRIPERIDGIGLMAKILALADRRGYSVFLLGAKHEIVEACVSKIQRDYPGIRIAGYRNGYFKPDQAASVAAEVRAVQPDILFLGMGSPMKERFADQYAGELGAAVIQGVGGSFDVMAGLVKRAPFWIQRIGFEWLYRVWQEPRRMFSRYLKTNTQCLLAFIQALVTPTRHAKRPTPVLST
jgi:N-acetylglucosaminyldiphosphoundecaprenol N-acetyl-beta-D-mannosaminyltransferase